MHFNMVGEVGFEPTSPKEQIYSLPQPSNFAAHPNYGIGFSP